MLNNEKKQLKAGWCGCRKVSGVVCDERVAKEIGKGYKRVVRPSMLYGLEMVVQTKYRR